jgi:hypothetical protein
MAGIDARRRSPDRGVKVLLPSLELSPRSHDPVRPPSQRQEYALAAGAVRCPG